MDQNEFKKKLEQYCNYREDGYGRCADVPENTGVVITEMFQPQGQCRDCGQPGEITTKKLFTLYTTGWVESCTVCRKVRSPDGTEMINRPPNYYKFRKATTTASKRTGRPPKAREEVDSESIPEPQLEAQLPTIEPDSTFVTESGVVVEDYPEFQIKVFPPRQG